MDISIILTVIFGLITLLFGILPIVSNILDIRDKFAASANKAIAMFYLSGIDALKFRESMTSLHAIKDYYTANISHRGNENYVVLTRLTLQLVCKGLDRKNIICLHCKIFACRIIIIFINVSYKISLFRFWLCEYYPIRFRHKWNLRKRIKRNSKIQFNKIMKWYEDGCPKLSS